MRFVWLILKVLLAKETIPVSKASRIATYCRLRLKQSLFTLTNSFPSSETIFGRTISLGDYRSFVHLYEEVFLGLEYYFRSSVAAPLIIDAGSNIGMATLFFKMLHPEAAVLCFEPGGSSFQCLSSNILGNYPDDVRCYKYALDTTSGDELLLHSGAEASLMASLLKERNAGGEVTAESVRTARLSDFIDRPVELLKMDIEGNEHAVLADLETNGKWDLIRQAIIEYHHHISGDDDKLGAFLGALEEKGFHYQIHASYRPPFTPGQFQDILIYAYRMQ